MTAKQLAYMAAVALVVVLAYERYQAAGAPSLRVAGGRAAA